jgi:hypothetical protein
MKALLWIPLLILVLGCVRAGKDFPEGNATEVKRVVNGLEVTLQTEKAVYKSGQTIVMSLTVTNKGDKPLELIFSSSQRYDFVVEKEGKEIWRWSKDKFFAMVLGEFTLQPDQSLVYEDTWAQEDNAGKLVPPGKYEIIGILTTAPESITSYSLNIEIVR